MPRLFKRKGGWSTLLLLIGMVLASAWTLVATESTDRLGIVPLAGLGGLAAGLFLGCSVFRGWLSHLFSAVYGVAWVGFLVGRGLPAGLIWRERILQLIGRFSHWIDQAVTGGTGDDPLIFVILMSGLFWVLGYNAAWSTYRRTRAWSAVLPLAIFSVIVTYYYIGPAPLLLYLGFFLFFTLLYVGRTHAFEQKEEWRRRQVTYESALDFDLFRSSFVLSLIVLSLAWILPSAGPIERLGPVQHRFSKPWYTLREEWQRLFSSLRGGTGEPVGAFGSSFTLGGPRDLEETLVMEIDAPREGRYYWRTAVYGAYRGSSWEAREEESILLSPGQKPSGLADYDLRRTVTQKVINYAPSRNLAAAAPQPIAISRSAEAFVVHGEDVPLGITRVILPLGPGEQYTVTSRVSEADATSLRQAGADYQEWVEQRYLQLPDSLPNRVRGLAREITASADNPYDKAKALERYLRDSITYDLAPPGVPEGRDYVDFLLFESRRGYCDGYATSMVVLARSVGIPARLATGYAEGEYAQERGVFQVREDEAHSWPEVYFPSYGWVEFEPTASEEPLLRSEPNEEEGRSSGGVGGAFPRRRREELERYLLEQDRASTQGAEPRADRGFREIAGWAVGSLTLLALIIGGGWWGVENWGFRGLPIVERAYARLLRFGSWLGRPLDPSETPFEWMRGVSALVPEAGGPLNHIVELYVRSAFAQEDAAESAAETAWRQVRPLLWRHLLWRRWPRRIASLFPFLHRRGDDS